MDFGMNKQISRKKLGLAVAVGLVVSPSVMAIEAAGVAVGGTTLTPTLTLTHAYDDNWTESASGSENDSWITRIAPSFTLAAKDRLNEYSLTWDINHEMYSDSSAANNTDNTLGAKAHMEFDSRNRVDLALGLSSQEDNAASAPEDYDSTTFSAVYGYGAKGALLGLDFGVSQERKRYDLVTYDGKELTSTAYSVKGRYNVSSATRAVAEYRLSDFDYKTANSLDSSANTFLVGAEWDATAKTSGSAKIGTTSKDFDAAGIADADSTVWEVGVTWAPRTYSTVSLNTSQSLSEGSGTENYKDTTTTSLNWNHQWSSMLTSDLSWSRTTDEYKGGSNGAINLEDDTDTLGASLTYNLRRWVDLSVGISRKDKTSTDATQSFDSNVVQMGVVVGF